MSDPTVEKLRFIVEQLADGAAALVESGIEPSEAWLFDYLAKASSSLESYTASLCNLAELRGEDGEADEKDREPVPEELLFGAIIPVDSDKSGCPVCKDRRSWRVADLMRREELHPVAARPEMTLAEVEAICGSCGWVGTFREQAIAHWCDEHGVPLPPHLREARRDLEL